MSIYGFFSGIGLIYCIYNYDKVFEDFMIKSFLFCMNIYANTQIWLKNYFKIQSAVTTHIYIK
jgi:hypothetical protein